MRRGAWVMTRVRDRPPGRGQASSQKPDVSCRHACKFYASNRREP